MRKLIIFIFILLLTSCNNKKTTLSTPNNLNIENYILYWDKVENASTYHILINDIEYTTDKNELDLSFLDNGEYKIKIMASGNNYLDSKYSKIITYSVHYTVPKNLVIKDKILTWDSIKTATKYTIYLNDNKYEVTSNSFDLSQLPENNFYTIKIKAHYNYNQSDFSEEINYHTFKDVYDTIQVSFNKNSTRDLVLDYDYSILTIENCEENNYQINDKKLTIFNSCLKSLNIGNNILTLFTNYGKVLLIIDIHQDTKPEIISDNQIHYNGEDITIYFDLFGGIISSINDDMIINEDYSIENDKLIVYHEFIDKVLMNNDRLIICYTLSNKEYTTIGYIFIYKN